MTTAEPIRVPARWTYATAKTGPSSGIEVWAPTPDDGSRSIRVTDPDGNCAGLLLPSDQVAFLITALQP